MRSFFVLLATIISQCCFPQAVSEFPPYLPERFFDFPVNGGRCHAMAVHPFDRNTVITSNEFGGLWKTTDGGNTWRHLGGMNTLFTNDICFSPDGNTLICTRNIDNDIDNGSGIWMSRDGGDTWIRPTNGSVPIIWGRTSERTVAWGISYDPDDAQKIYVGTSSGIAISGDGGLSWRHSVLETSSPTHRDFLQNEVLSVLAYGGNVVFALTRTGVYKTSDGGSNWSVIRTGDFTFGKSFKLMDIWDNQGVRGGGRGVFILKDYDSLLIYENFYNRWTSVPLPGGESGGPFVTVSKAASQGYLTVWVGTGVNLRKITKSRISSFLPGLVSKTSWLTLHRAEGIHDDSGIMGLDADRKIVFYASDGGLFRPLNEAGTRWTNACLRGSGMNSYQVTDLNITNHDEQGPGGQTDLYFGTQDNAVWASSDRGENWINPDCCEGFHIEVRDRAGGATPIRVAYARVGNGAQRIMSDIHLTNPRMVPVLSTDRVDLADSVLGQAFLINSDNYYRLRYPVAAEEEGYVSDNGGDSWRKRYHYSGISTRGVWHASRAGRSGPARGWIPFSENGVMNPDGSFRVGLVQHLYPMRAGTATFTPASIRYLPNSGSLGIRGTEFDWQAVFGVNPVDYRHIIAPDIVNGVIKVSRNGGSSWTTDERLTTLVTKNGLTRMYYGTPNIEVTQISWDPYHTNRILVGTLHNGAMLSEDGGATWRKIRGSEKMIFITSFAFQPDNIVYVSSYGRGLWKIDLNVFVSSPVDFFNCRFCSFFDQYFTRTEIGNLSDYTVMEIRGGQVTGHSYDQQQNLQVHVSNGALYKTWLPEKSGLAAPGVTRTKQPDPAIEALKKSCQDCAVTGIVIKGQEVIGYLVQKEEQPFEKGDHIDKDYPLPKDDGANEKEEGEPAGEMTRPVAAITAGSVVNGLAVLGEKDELVIALNNINDIPVGSVISIGKEPVLTFDKSGIAKGHHGYAIRLKLPPGIRRGMHMVTIETPDKKNTYHLAFIVAAKDEFEKNLPGKKQIPEKEVIDD